MRKRSEIVAAGPVVGRRILKSADERRLAWYREDLARRWSDIPTEREDIRKIVRRYNRRFKRMSGQSLKGC